jgi:hypothetical protein
VIASSIAQFLVLPMFSSASVDFSESHAIGSSVTIPPGFDFNWLTIGFMKHSGLGKVSILKIEASRTPRAILTSNGPNSYEVDVLVRACADAQGFRAVMGSHSADIADAVSSHLFLLPAETRGINSTYFGIEELPVSGSAPTLIRGRLLTLAPTMKPKQCFVGIATFAVPIQIGSPSNSTMYSVALTTSTYPIPGQAILWSPPPKA